MNRIWIKPVLYVGAPVLIACDGRCALQHAGTASQQPRAGRFPGWRAPMKVTVRLPTDIEVARLRCVLPYDEEDFEEQDLADFPGRMGGPRRGHLPLEIDLNTSRVVGWPEGRHASLHLKVVDSGIYTLIGANGKTLREHEDYVPDWLPGEHGDYFIADIQGDGAIFKDGKPWKADAAKVTAWLDDLIDEDDGR